MLRKSGLLLTLFLMAGCATATEKLRIYTEQYPPYNMTTNGQPFAHKARDVTGLCTDVMKALLDGTDLEYSIKLRDLSYGLKRTKQHPNHGIYCVSKTEERKPFFKWIGPLSTIEWTLFAKPGSSIELENLQDARDYQIGGYRGDVMTGYLADKGFDVSAISNNGLNAQRLVQDQIDLWVADGLAGPYLAADASDVTDLKRVLVFRETPMYLAVHKDTDPVILKALREGYQRLVQSGEKETITRSYGL
ncbi:amino acid ABC transporter substrate-binding protein (PAAT family) [Tamilnaduibacter salinus]|uniref:Amino acid ABC transporter substrate-binding protein n=1 Tax=Tamilnaduibacter salinus TaxID=1484056 RepID=A0A2A2I1N1_9GAMM|nr:transporter substrate-binding domain-containing protein [Tamilnaduibacter salinus]PAV24913.1 amino acid ABC transporter substrate-binding protein [Tamilnaduibacter salinus]PVY78083.1 amino acid ABC transporter substrate-binding protein (PAAT family) [Tamilnaduibacter salinus]